jgi:UDP-glucuronate 4-epimerase
MTENMKFLVTGASGCIGSWVVKNLVACQIPVVAVDKSNNKRRLQLIMSDRDIGSVEFVPGDIIDLDFLTNLVSNYQVTHIIHLAALQVPFCASNPSLGAMVNVVGTVNIFEAAKRSGINHLTFASSTAVYGLDEEYPEGKITEESALRPRSHYGVYKQANEGTSRIYWQENKVSSIGLRPYVAYGAGRDQGLTSTPTIAIYKAMNGEPYAISFTGRYCFQYVDDIAKTYIKAAQTPLDGAKTLNIGGPSFSSEEIAEEITRQIPHSKNLITIQKNQLPFPSEVDRSELVKIIGEIPFTELSRGIFDTIATFRYAIERGIQIEI